MNKRTIQKLMIATLVAISGQTAVTATSGFDVVAGVGAVATAVAVAHICNAVQNHQSLQAIPKGCSYSFHDSNPGGDKSIITMTHKHTHKIDRNVSIFCATFFAFLGSL